MKGVFKYLILCLFFTISLPAQPGEIVLISDPSETYDLFDHALILEDENSEIGIQDILSGRYDDQFKPAKGFIEMPARQRGYWLRVSVQKEVEDVVYTFKEYVGTVEADLYEVAGGEVINRSELSHLRKEEAGEEFRQSVLYENLKIREGETHELILFVRGVKMKYLPWFVGSQQAFIRQVHRNDLFYGFVYGLFAIIILYNLMLYARLREADYLFYSLNMIFLALLLFNYHGHPYEFVLNGYQELKNYVEVYAALAGLFHLLFAMVFLKVRVFSKWVRYTFYFFIAKYALDMLVSLAGFSDDLYPLMSAGTTAMLSDLYIVIIGIYAAVRGFFPAILFVVARLALVVSVFITAFYSMGRLDHSEFAYNALHVGASIEMVLFALAISYKIRLLKIDKERAQREKEEYIKAQNVLLEKKVKARTYELEQEQEKSERLLLNILPKSIAEELKSNGHSEARKVKDVTVLFTDFQNFTQSTRDSDAELLIEELNLYFKKFDEITSKYGVEKIKTIGDSYMAAGGIPELSDPVKMALQTVRAGIEMQQFVELQVNTNKSSILNKMRIGVHTGDVIAGVVGNKKFQYDIWGESVNLAARMENSGEIGRINISSATYELVKGVIRCEYRGQILAKNIGEVDMYFVTSDEQTRYEFQEEVKA